MARTIRRPQVGVLGSAEPGSTAYALAGEAGVLLARLGVTVVSGCGSPATRFAAQSAQEAGGLVISIIPEDQMPAADWPATAVLPSGVGDARNLLMALAGDACLVIGGRAGTISEVCLAWLHKRPLLPLVGCGGWSDQLPENPPDERRNSLILPWASTLELEQQLRALGLVSVPVATRRRWSEVQTVHGLPGDQIASALQKEIRRGQTENAALIAHEMVISGSEMEAYLWSRLLVISVEDIGLGEPTAPILLNALHQMVQSLPAEAGERKLFAIHAVRYLCGCQKDRSSDELTGWIAHVVAQEGVRPVIPDYALDGHTVAGRARGRGLRYFYEEGAKLAPELPNRDTRYRDRIMALLDEGKM